MGFEGASLDRDSVEAELRRLDRHAPTEALAAYLAKANFEIGDIEHCVYRFATEGLIEPAYVLARVLAAAGATMPGVDFLRAVGGALFGVAQDEKEGIEQLPRSLRFFGPDQIDYFRAKVVIPAVAHAAATDRAKAEPDLLARLVEIANLVPAKAPDAPIVRPVPENQLWPQRAAAMASLVRGAFGAPVTALEIGVWYGIGSTRLWLEHLPAESTLFLLDAWRPYASADDLKDRQWDYKSMDELTTAAFLSAFETVKQFETTRAERKLSVHLTRGDSKAFLPLLEADSFDFIYIDGDHKYAKAKADIAQAKRLVNKKFGIICGDDLESLPTPELLALSEQHKDIDFIRGRHQFHPGVMLAIAEEFERVNMLNGFWWIACADGAFRPDLFEHLAGRD